MHNEACRHCWHDIAEHDSEVGCRFCTCLATPGEARPQTLEELEADVLEPGQYREGYGPKPATVIHSDLVTALDNDEVLIAQWREGKLVVVDPTPDQMAKFAEAIAAQDEREASQTQLRIADLDGTDDAPEWLVPGHVLTDDEVGFLRSLTWKG